MKERTRIRTKKQNMSDKHLFEQYVSGSSTKSPAATALDGSKASKQEGTKRLQTGLAQMCQVFRAELLVARCRVSEGPMRPRVLCVIGRRVGHQRDK